MVKVKLNNKKNFIRVNFTNRGLAKAMNRKESLDDDTPDKNSVLHIAKLLDDVKITRGAPIKFKSIPEFVGIDYVGYIIEKERFNKKTGEWVRIDEFKIIGTEANSFIDTRVAYGESYRYRMKTIIKLTKAEKKVGLSHLEAIEDIKKFETKKIQKALEKNKNVLKDLDRFTNLGLSSKKSSGKPFKNIPLLSGMSIRANELNTSLFQQSSASNKNLRSMKNLRVEDLNLARGNASRSDLQKIINKNLTKFKEQKVEYFSSYYESNPSKNWVYAEIEEHEPPPPPQTIKIVPNSLKKQIMVSWLKPANSQRDIKYFKIYKRSDVGQRWTLLSESREVDVDEDGLPDDLEAGDIKIPATSNLFIDKNVQFGRKYIYALSCVDVHDIESFLSVQIGAELNPNFAIEKEEKPLKWISGSGTRPDEIDFVIKKFLNRTEQIIAKNNFFIAPTTKFAETNKDLIIKIKSLDTHETKELKVSLRNTNVKPPR